LLEPGDGFHHDAHAGQVGESVRDGDLLLDEHAATGQCPEPLLMAHYDAARGSLLALDYCGVAFAPH